MLPPVPERPLPYAALTGLLSGLFAVITWQVAAYGPLREADEWLSGLLRQPAPSPGAGAVVAQSFADLGSPVVALPVLAAAMGYACWRGGRWRPVLCYAVVMAAVPLLVLPLKALLDRPGPVDGSGYYPSGHTATAVVAYGATAALLLPFTPGVRARRGVVAAAVLLVLATAVGLVRRGFHWPLDVVASWCLGGLLMVGAAAWLTRRHRRPTPPPHALPAPAPPDQ
ncbi:phosphatase PAP2 family protein [Streptomyces gobiensis]|uniref:phosphatase PAP2 family protein n=1 Tax=Streptomyces gobiensis TaxID=2875706 RepID=UPI001E434540|nr:phosphatase PAP2 family protein [Streptomyces gobiensis]UGY93874.1 phosphatase PAP2 family protein [Streptomyces gobiensis]